MQRKIYCDVLLADFKFAKENDYGINFEMKEVEGENIIHDRRSDGSWKKHSMPTHERKAA